MILLLGLSLAWSTPSLARAPDYPVTLQAGLGGGVGPTESALSGGGWGVGRALVHYRDVALDLGLREGLVGGDLRAIGAIGAGLRWMPGLPYARVGFVHHHETPWAVLEADPVLSTIGSSPGIRHRSGLDLALGIHGPMTPKEAPEQRLGAFAELSVVAFPDDRGPVVYGTLDLGFSYAVGRDRSAALPE